MRSPSTATTRSTGGPPPQSVPAGICRLQIWSLWDAGDLVRLHSTQLGAQDAREIHLYRHGDLPAEEQALLDRATEICPTLLHVT
jgi:hypothetical protein